MILSNTPLPSSKPHLSPVLLGVKGRCPRCGQGKLFKGLLTVAPQCDVCELDYGFADSADGPAVFVTLLAGAIVAGVALYMEFTFEPAWWIHALVQIPLVCTVCVLMLRPLKGILICLQYANQAQEMRFQDTRLEEQNRETH
jgi:uncharacterized protein (DUF983 family)